MFHVEHSDVLREQKDLSHPVSFVFHVEHKPALPPFHLKIHESRANLRKCLEGKMANVFRVEHYPWLPSSYFGEPFPEDPKYEAVEARSLRAWQKS